MLCKNPFMVGVLPAGCGQCLSCLINRRRLWVHRMILESAKHAGSCFVTLTYDDKHLPLGGTLEPDDTQKWLKRLRKIISPEKIRYFLVGEYGEKANRPHYHVALFGLDQLKAGGDDGKSGVIKESWTLDGSQIGHIFVGDLNQASASYIAGYVTKKLTKHGDPRLNGRHPEFARMSLRPGIGAGAVPDIVASLSTSGGLNAVANMGDVPTQLRHGKKLMPLGRYLSGRLRTEMGFATKKSPEQVRIKNEAKVRNLLQSSLARPENKAKKIKEILLDMYATKRLSMENRFKIHSKKGSL